MSDRCGICGSTRLTTRTVPTRCLTCGATKSEEWFYDDNASPSVAEVRKLSGYKISYFIYSKDELPIQRLPHIRPDETKITLVIIWVLLAGLVIYFIIEYF